MGRYVNELVKLANYKNKNEQVGESSFEEGVDDNDRIDRVSLDGNEVIDDNEVVTDEVLNDDTNPIFDQNLIEINEDDDDFNQSVDGSGHTAEHQVNIVAQLIQTKPRMNPRHQQNLKILK
ncbi:hypothetical protein QTN25_008413 [Entamoeba marina]